MDTLLESELNEILRAGAAVPIDTRGLVHVWARNDMADAQQMGISWVVTDPTGRVREQYSAWEQWPYTGAGKEHEFIGNRFTLDKIGTWKIVVALFMNLENPVVVDTYDGILCKVGKEFSGSITKKELEYDGKRSTIPVS